VRMLLNDDAEAIAASVRSLGIDGLRALRPWEMGLIETIHAIVYQANGDSVFEGMDLLDFLDEAQRSTCLRRRRRYFAADVSNIRCALSLRSSLDVKAAGLTNDGVQKIVAERRRVEHRNAVLRLLDQELPLSELAKYPYYLKVVLDETLFAPFRFDWSPRFMTDIHAVMFAAS